MTLVECPTCGGGVAKSAKECPHCGANRVPRQFNGCAALITVLVVLFVIFYAIAEFG